MIERRVRQRNHRSAKRNLQQISNRAVRCSLDFTAETGHKGQLFGMPPTLDVFQRWQRSCLPLSCAQLLGNLARPRFELGYVALRVVGGLDATEPNEKRVDVRRNGTHASIRCAQRRRAGPRKGLYYASLSCTELGQHLVNQSDRVGGSET